MVLTKRMSFHACFKRKVILHAEEYGNRHASRTFGVAETNVRRWRLKRDALLLTAIQTDSSGKSSDDTETSDEDE